MDGFCFCRSSQDSVNKSPNTPDKRIRKQTTFPDFVQQAVIKRERRAKSEESEEEEVEIDTENIQEQDSDMEEDEMHDGNSSTEGESSPSKYNGHGGRGFGPEFPCPVCKKIFRKKGHMTRWVFVKIF